MIILIFSQIVVFEKIYDIKILYYIYNILKFYILSNIHIQYNKNYLLINDITTPHWHNIMQVFYNIIYIQSYG